MNKQPASLIPAVEIDAVPNTGINAVLDSYDYRLSNGYFSGNHIMTAVNGPFGIPYWMQGLALQTCVNMYISAPEPWQNNIQYHTSPTLYTAGQYAVGTAPVSGVYTGVEDCG